VAEYYQVMLTILAARPELMPIQIGREEEADDPTRPATNFERKARKEGRPVWRATFQKK
jgi:tRNA G46 methylase TrmB